MPGSLNIVANYHREGDLVEAELHLQQGTAYIPDQIASGFMKLQFLNPKDDDGGTFTLVDLAQIDLSASFKTSNGIVVCRFLHPKENLNLQLQTHVVLQNASVLDSVVPVIDIDTNINPSQQLAEQKIPAFEHAVAPDDEVKGTIEMEGHRLGDTRPLERNNVIQDPQLALVLYRMDFSKETPLVEGLQGTINYTGGGNRYFPVGGKLLLQNADQVPWDLGDPLFIEDQAINLANNPSFAPNPMSPNNPLGYSSNAPGLAIEAQLVAQLNASINTWVVTFKGTNQINPFTAAYVQPMASVVIDPSKVLTGSFLLGINFPVDGSDISTLKVIVGFRDNLDGLLATKIFTFNPTDYETSLGIVQWTLLPTDYPIGCDRILWQVEIGSVEAGDVVQLNVAMPQLEYNESATSRVFGGTRLADSVVVTTTLPVTMNQGTFTMKFVAGHNGFTPSNRWLFDTRTILNPDGFAAYQRGTDGRIVFVLQSGVFSQEVATTNPYNFVAGQTVEFGFSWATNLRRITSETSNLGDDLTAYFLPTGFTNSVVYGASPFAPGRALNGELLTAYILRDPR